MAVSTTTPKSTTIGLDVLIGLGLAAIVGLAADKTAVPTVLLDGWLALIAGRLGLTGAERAHLGVIYGDRSERSGGRGVAC